MWRRMRSKVLKGTAYRYSYFVGQFRTMATFHEITTAMAEAVELDGKVKKKINAVVVFDVNGEKFEVNASLDADATNKPPDLTVMTSVAVLQELLEKKLTPQQDFLKGKIKIKGKMVLAMKLQLILDATRKHLARQTARL